MRQIVLDTETTGLNPRTGDRVIEIGCVELVNRTLTGNNYHRYINPERESDEGALAVHGLTTEFLSDKPKFHEIVDELRAEDVRAQDVRRSDAQQQVMWLLSEPRDELGVCRAAIKHVKGRLADIDKGGEPVT